MFDNIGGKIKGLARVIFAIEAIGTLIGALLVGNQFDTPVVGILIVVGGFVFAWVSVFFVYGFGELIERTTSIDEKLSVRTVVSQAVTSQGVLGVAYTPTRVPSKEYYDIVRGEKLPAGVCDVCRQTYPELWSCITKKGNRYKEKKMCQNCIDHYGKKQR